MKISDITGLGLAPQGFIEFDSAERDAYVSRFIAVFSSGDSEEEICSKAYEIHLELRNRHDLYIAVSKGLTARQRSALHWYSACKGKYAPKPKYEVEP